jgi:hypothetical protein
VGTGYEGEVWRFVNQGGARLASVDAVQVVAILDSGAALLTQGPATVLRRDGDQKRTPRFRIDAKQFPNPVRFGQFEISPAAAGTRIRFRSGASEKPDESWLPWTEWQPSSGGAVPLPPGKSLQWEIELPLSRSASLGVERVEVAFREVNLAPRMVAISVAEPGAVWLAAPPPSGPVIEAAHPDFSGIFSVIDEKRSKPSKPQQGKRYWRVGYRTVSWKAEDPNKDPLRFRVELERQDGFRLPVREQLKTTQLALDTTAVPDGTYRFCLAATDELGNPGEALQADATSRWFVVDNTPPKVQLVRHGQDWTVSVEDDLSPVSRVEWNRDGERWQALAPADGILDGRRESFRFPVHSGRHLVVVRVTDEHHNRTTVGAAEE